MQTSKARLNWPPAPPPPPPPKTQKGTTQPPPKTLATIQMTHRQTPANTHSQDRCHRTPRAPRPVETSWLVETFVSECLNFNKK